ncbi:hypothetical protein SDC9_51641 [bioreactor metagenome]|uniref:Secretion system C-terminal sorting domain-containing protein n=1 Tax=bioreactor metagenome TaxID=1076179 RepID=A0A644WT54_9ZZZZ
MKKFLLPFFVLVLIGTTQAQMVINAGDMPVPGTVITMTEDTTPSGALPVFTTGANVNWDFTALNNQSPDVIAFVDPSTTPYYSSFPNATLCYMAADSMFGYLFANNDYAVALGARAKMDTIEIIMKYDPDDTLFTFPYTFGTTMESHPCGAFKLFYGDSIDVGLGNIYVDSVRITMCYDKNTVVDGWGNVTTPVGTYQALRSSRVEIEEQEFAIYYMGMWIPVNTSSDTTLVIEWNMKNTGVPLISVYADPNDSSFTNIEWLTVSPSFGFNDIVVSNELNIYPNPVADEATISFDGDIPELITITDISGREIISFEVNNQTKMKIDVSDIDPGIYFVLSAKRGQSYRTGRFIKL